MGKEKTHINIVVIGHVDSGKDKENSKEEETVYGTEEIRNFYVRIEPVYRNYPANTGKHRFRAATLLPMSTAK